MFNEKEKKSVIVRDNLKIVLKANNTTQKEIAEKLGLNVDYFRECLQVGKIATEYLLQIAEILNVHPDYLSGEKDLKERSVFEGGYLTFFDFKRENFDIIKLVNDLIEIVFGYKIKPSLPQLTENQYFKIWQALKKDLYNVINEHFLMCDENITLPIIKTEAFLLLQVCGFDKEFIEKTQHDNCLIIPPYDSDYFRKDTNNEKKGMLLQELNDLKSDLSITQNTIKSAEKLKDKSILKSANNDLKLIENRIKEIENLLNS